ncbi:MAG: phage tail protein [Clostridia bacterium]|nr:phage tail protein [Clostridia bacterium]
MQQVGSALGTVDAKLKTTETELREVQKQLKFDPSNTELLAQKQELLGKRVADSRTKLDTLNSMLEQHTAKMKAADTVTEEMEAEHRALVREVEKTKNQIQNFGDQLEETTRKAPMMEKIGSALDAWREKSEKAKDKMTGLTGLKNNYDKLKDAVEACKEKHFVLFGALDKVKEGLSKVGDAAKKAAHIGFDALKTGAKAAGAALAAVTAGAIKLGKDVVESFGELEQNLGGSEAVFGEYASRIQSIGEEAYKNLGVTQSDYLATANKMGALFQGSGLSQKESLDMTEKAMQRAADMASVMGIETSAALEAVTGAAKGNYTMMDNLGVKMDATTLAAYAAAEGFTKEYKDMSNTEKTELAMRYFFENTKQYAGNFARESSETISGSIGMLKTSAQSLLAGLGNADADIQNLAGNVIESFGLVAKNVSPVIQNIADSLPALAETAVKALDGDLLPTVMNCFTSLVQSLSKTAPKIIITLADGLLDNADKLIDSALGIVAELTEGLLSPENLKKLLSTALSLVVKLSGYLVDNIDHIIDAAFTMIETLVESLLEDKNLQKLIHAAFDIVVNIAGGLISNLPTLIRAAWELCVALVDAIIHYDWLSVGKEIFNSIKGAIANFFTGGSSSGGGGYDGSHANGLAFVPYDGYVAQLHYGERVLTREENEAYKNGGVSVTLSIGEFHNYRQEDINHLADEISEVLAAKLQRKQGAFA